MRWLRGPGDRIADPHDASHVLGAVATIVGGIIVVNNAWSSPSTGHTGGVVEPRKLGLNHVPGFF